MGLRSKIIFSCLIFFFLSCSGTKLMDSWKAQSFNSIESAKILVISRTPEVDIRKSYESAIASKLRAQNIDAVESHIQFPSLKEVSTPEEQNRIVRQFENAGITAVILTSLKQTIETQNGGIRGQTGIPEEYEDRKSFAQDVMNVDQEASTSKTYVLEGLIYNLTLEEDKQLVNVCLVDVTDPDSPEKIQKAFTKIIAEQFK